MAWNLLFCLCLTDTSLVHTGVPISLTGRYDQKHVKYYQKHVELGVKHQTNKKLYKRINDQSTKSGILKPRYRKFVLIIKCQ